MASGVWEVRWLHFNDGIGFEHVNAELARVAAGWQPFTAMQHRDTGWVMFVRREAAQGQREDVSASGGAES